MVIKQFQNFTANKVLTNTRLLFVRALESRLSIFLTLKPHHSHEKILCIKLAKSIQRHTSHDPFYLFWFCSLCLSNQGSLLIGIHPISDQIFENKPNIDAFNLVLSGL